MTHRLYYDDPYNRDFSATVLHVEPRDRAHAVWLDRSSFYPTSGGQPFDTGTLGDGAVVDVIDDEGEVVHLVEGGQFNVGTTVHGCIDWTRRFDHMQQHSGQHVLSAALVKAVSAPTLSFHMGSELSTIDLAHDVTPEQIDVAERLANEVVWENRPITVRYADAKGAADLGLRKPSARQGVLRVIDIADFDLSACGGAHVTSTGAVGVIVVTGWERFKGGLRVEFACGGRAVKRHTLLRETVAASVRYLSVQPHELPVAIERLRAELHRQKRLSAEQSEALAGYQATELAEHAQAVGDRHVVVASVNGDANGLKAVARAITQRSGYAVILLSKTSPAAIVAMRSADSALACDAVVRTMCSHFGGRGGGRPDFAQAGGLAGRVDEMLAEAQRLAITPTV